MMKAANISTAAAGHAAAGHPQQNIEGFLASIVEFSDNAIITKTLDGTITTWNRAAEKFFGYTAEEAIGHHISILIPHDREAEELWILSRLRKGECIDHHETVRRRKDGSVMNVSVTVLPIRDKDGNVVGAAKVVRDLAPRVKRIRTDFPCPYSAAFR
jgi:PAS domain S-box-containing protein